MFLINCAHVMYLWIFKNFTCKWLNYYYFTQQTTFTRKTNLIRKTRIRFLTFVLFNVSIIGSLPYRYLELKKNCYFNNTVENLR